MMNKSTDTSENNIHCDTQTSQAYVTVDFLYRLSPYLQPLTTLTTDYHRRLTTPHFPETKLFPLAAIPALVSISCTDLTY